MKYFLLSFIFCGCAVTAQNYCYQQCQNSNTSFVDVDNCQTRCDLDTNYGQGVDKKTATPGMENNNEKPLILEPASEEEAAKSKKK